MDNSSAARAYRAAVDNTRENGGGNSWRDPQTGPLIGMGESHCKSDECRPPFWGEIGERKCFDEDEKELPDCNGARVPPPVTMRI